jgi:hypothetical protein
VIRLPVPARWLWRAAAVLALALVFASYFQPSLVLDLATQIWNCF